MSDNGADWYLVENGKSVGPLILADLVRRLAGSGGSAAMVFGPGLAAWTAAGQVPAVAAAMRAPAPMSYSTPPPPPLPMGSHFDQIDCTIVGAEIQYVQVALDPGDTVIGEPGFMMYMTSNVQMNTVFGDPSSQQPQGFFDKLKTAGKRVLTGESALVSTFTNTGSGKESVAFAAHHPGKMIEFDLAEHGGQMICQKECFVCAARGVSLGIAFQKRIMVGLFGGEGFIMQRLTGAGKAIIAVGGTLFEKSLAPGETLKIDTGCLVALESSVNFDVQFVGGIKNAAFGGEGVFFATVTGPGKVWIQSMPFSRLAARVLAHYRPGNTEASGNPLINAGLGAVFGNRD
jgi:uncharacterized protein (AIM24 family)